VNLAGGVGTNWPWPMIKKCVKLLKNKKIFHIFLYII
jgi:hypothetical protein